MSYSWGAGQNARVEGRHARAALEAVPATPTREITAALVPEDSAASPDSEHERVAAELAPMVEVWQRLLAEHVPDRGGRCRTCTKGGTGLPSTSWPCSIRGIAEMARRRHDADLAAAARRERLSS
jgi:phosphodiesterase/alkaline phosphatase D-like protein